MENTGRKGMSKGCLVSLIIVGAVVVLALAFVMLAYVFKDDLTSFGAAAQVSEVKKHIADNPHEGVDTVRFNLMADAFNDRLKTDEKPRLDELVFMMQDLIAIVADGEVDASESATVIDAMLTYYPDLETQGSGEPTDLMPSGDETSGQSDTLSNN